ncbi:MAG: hypothetical protein R3E68_19450 [Burkholderiaceae bacterium]
MTTAARILPNSAPLVSVRASITEMFIWPLICTTPEAVEVTLMLLNEKLT